MNNYMLTWQDETQPVFGEGLSRTSNPAAKLWQVSVRFAAGPPMKTTVLALNKSEALKFSKNRHPNATKITVLGKA